MQVRPSARISCVIPHATCCALVRCRKYGVPPGKTCGAGLAMHFVSDRDYLARLYRRQFGRWPDLDQPRGFNEKILVKILNDRRAYLTLFSDKLRVRDYVRRTAPMLHLPTLYWWSDRAETIPIETLPNEFVLKANHGSGWNCVVQNKAACGGRISSGLASAGSNRISRSSAASGPTRTSGVRSTPSNCSRMSGAARRRTTSCSSSAARCE